MFYYVEGNLTTTGPVIWFKLDSNSIIIDSDEFAVNYSSLKFLNINPQ